MSIKIYNGYILDQNYSLRELNDLFVDLRKKMQETDVYKRQVVQRVSLYFMITSKK